MCFATCCGDQGEVVKTPTIERSRLLEMFKALSDPTRFDIFMLVAVQEAPICACDVVARFEVSQPTISHHMKILRQAGLITVSRRGVWAYYAVDPDGLSVLRDSVVAIERASLVPAR